MLQVPSQKYPDGEWGLNFPLIFHSDHVHPEVIFILGQLLGKGFVYDIIVTVKIFKRSLLLSQTTEYDCLGVAFLQ